MHCRVRISATTEDEANSISKTLVNKMLVAGTMIYKGLCHYRWKDKVVEHIYWNIGAFSLDRHKQAIIDEVKNLHSDDCPIIAFNDIDGNKEFLDWIEESVK
jgi:uncharacterized protein involved in tolerance to divalent cations